ncbi:tRNA-modifying protein YgfZ [Bacterioplanes sanyensis]|uniref:CAF17-like 4Fe-4S cluster assembly/insertion protein YgfZ n=1 Tax=Bacterioplanes sanyensis TaxID=1249553 RepID=UPI00167BA428|nr:folate-binding protein YgfZ [Bacterioplanes sanyensis]GGY45284.1 tRNA-modifying protein YgfZ [Bacterioplanes sanyensis]
MSVLSIEGSDCERFLQGQLTCDVSKLDGQWQLGACCNAKGRMVANFVIARRGDECRVRLPADQAEALLSHLKKYAVFFKVTLSVLDDIWVVAQWQPQQHQPELANGWQLHWQDRSELWLPQTEALEWLQQQSLCSEQRWHEDDINAGLVWVTAATREHWIPQNIDWHRHGGVSFNKGCYTGQEIVARLQYLGKAKKGLFRLSSEQPADFDALATIRSSTGKTIGELASWRQSSGLGWINLSAADDNAINIDDTQLSCEAIAYTEVHE